MPAGTPACCRFQEHLVDMREEMDMPHASAQKIHQNCYRLAASMRDSEVAVLMLLRAVVSCWGLVSVALACHAFACR